MGLNELLKNHERAVPSPDELVTTKLTRAFLVCAYLSVCLSACLSVCLCYLSLSPSLSLSHTHTHSLSPSLFFSLSLFLAICLLPGDLNLHERFVIVSKLAGLETSVFCSDSEAGGRPQKPPRLSSHRRELPAGHQLRRPRLVGSHAPHSRLLRHLHGLERGGGGTGHLETTGPQFLEVSSLATSPFSPFVSIPATELKVRDDALNTHTHARTHSHTHTHTHARTHARTHKHTHTHTHTHTHARTQSHTHTHTHTHITNTHTHIIQTHTQACTHARTHTNTYTHCKHTHTHT